MEASAATRSIDVGQEPGGAGNAVRASYLRLHLANGFTAIRLLLITPFALLIAHGDKQNALAALSIYVIALATDFADGPIARKLGTVSLIGGTFDHTVDFLFVTSGLFAGALRGIFPWLLPSLIVVAFAQYFVDSYWIRRGHRGGQLRKSKLGRYNGILYFVPLCLAMLIRIGFGFFQPVLTVLVWALVASTIISMGQRLRFSFLAEKLPSGTPEK